MSFPGSLDLARGESLPIKFRRLSGVSSLSQISGTWCVKGPAVC